MGDQQAGGGRPPPSFTTLPIRACSDKRLTGTDLRVLGVISFHDRRSLARGLGAGCFAGQRIIAQRAGLDRKNVRQSIERLVMLGYLERTERASEKRGYVLRVIEVDPNSPPDAIGGAETPYVYDDDEAVDYFEGVQEPPQAGVQEPPHRGLGNPHNRTIRDLAEARRDSPEGARFSQTACDDIPANGLQISSTGSIHRDDLKEPVIFAASILGSQAALAKRSGVLASYISLARQGQPIPAPAAMKLAAECEIIIDQHAEHSPAKLFGRFGYYLPGNFETSPPGAQLAILEKAFKEAAGTSDLHHAKQSVCDFLAGDFGDEHDDSNNHRAMRMESDLSHGVWD